MAYFVDGIYRCGILLKDKPLTDLGLKNIHYTLEHPQPDGKLGPGPNDMKLTVEPDGVTGPTTMGAHWPFAVFTRALMAYYGETGDKRVLEALTKHYGTLSERFGIDNRDVDAIEGMCWLYTQTGDEKLIRQAERTWQNFENSPSNTKKRIWTLDGMTREAPLRGHGVSVCEISKQTAILYLATGKKEYLDAALGGFRSLKRDHELVDGVPSSDSGLSGKQPTRQHETCVVPDYTWSLGYALLASGDPRFADTIERGLYNAGLSVIDRDFKSHQYYSSANQMIATQTSNNPNTGIKNRNLQAYRPDFRPECCTGNVQRMLPTYIGRMWLSDGNGGVAAVLYGPSSVQTTVGTAHEKVSIKQTTDYPFSGESVFTVSAGKPVEFPFHFRIPKWAEGATVTVNGKVAEGTVQAGTFFTLQRTFADGDMIKLFLPMKVRMETPVPASQSLSRGPLLFSVKIKEEKRRVDDARGKDPDFPAWDYRPASSWNYGLALSGPEELSKVRIEARPVKDYPWTADSSPVVLTAPARQIPAWVLTEKGENPELPTAPFEVSAKTEEIQLVPQGATQLHLTVFPAITHDRVKDSSSKQ